MRAPRPSVRIIGGKWRGRRVPAPLSAPCRPSGDRIREALFNCLGQRLDGSACLDLFAGTGALGLEAASRGAAKVVFVERDAESVARIKETARMLDAEKSAQFAAARADIFAWLAARTEAEGLEEEGGVEKGDGISFDLIFADPPFADYRSDSAWEKLLSALTPRLAPDGRVYCESDRFFPLPPGWAEEKARKAGRARWRILRRGAAA